MQEKSRLGRAAPAWALIALTVLAYVLYSDGAPPGSELRSAAEGLVLHAEPIELPDLAFEDDAGRSVRLSEFRGRIVLLNIWATWCAPCREEMPTLDRLQARLGGPGFEIVTLSVDRNGLAAVRSFMARAGIENLRILLDRDSTSMTDAGVLGIPMPGSKGSLGVYGIPTTLLLGRDGRELGRLMGPAAWDSDATVTVLRRLVDAELP